MLPHMYRLPILSPFHRHLDKKTFLFHLSPRPYRSFLSDRNSLSHQVSLCLTPLGFRRFTPQFWAELRDIFGKLLEQRLFALLRIRHISSTRPAIRSRNTRCRPRGLHLRLSVGAPHGDENPTHRSQPSPHCSSHAPPASFRIAAISSSGVIPRPSAIAKSGTQGSADAMAFPPLPAIPANQAALLIPLFLMALSSVTPSRTRCGAPQPRNTEFRETLNGFLRLWLTRHGISFLPASLITGNISYHQTR